MPPDLIYGQPDTTSSDPGLFGPGSVSWRIHGDPAGLPSGVRALLLQALYPEAMAGVAQHSNYREDPWGRLIRTAEYIGVITFGTTEEAERAAARVRKVHRALGVDAPELLMWVHAGFTDSLLDGATRVGLSDADADAYVAEQVTAAELIGLPRDDVPTTATQLRDYYEYVRPRLRVIPEAREGAKLIVVPPMPGRARWLTPAQPLWAGLAATAFGMLPGWARRLYLGPIFGTASVLNPLNDQQATLSLRSWRLAFLALPEHVRRGPHMTAAYERLGLDV